MTMRIISKFHRRLQTHFFFIVCLCAGTDPNISFQKIMTNLREIILHNIQVYLQLHNCIFTNSTDNSYIYNCFTLSYSSLGLILSILKTSSQRYGDRVTCSNIIFTCVRI